MLSDEEKKAIDHIKNYPINWLIENVNESAIQTVLNLIEKQSKEIEELKNGQIDFWISDKEIEERIRNKFVSKDKLIELREIDNIDLIQCKLRKLLEGNNE